jgi:signal transduction histidine kinase
MRLSIADDGQGFDAQAARLSAHSSHWGLLSMKERAMAIGGDLQVSSGPGRGTTITVEVKQ